MSKRKELKKLFKLAGMRERLPLPDSGRVRLTEPEQVVIAFVEAWNDHDPEAVAKLFVDDADFVNVVGLWWTSRRSIRRAQEYGFGLAFANAKISVEEVSVRRLGEDVAVIHARWRLKGQVDPERKPTGQRRGVMSAVVTRLADGTWVAVSCHNTDIAPNADTFIADGSTLVATSYIDSPTEAEIAASELVEDA